METKLPLENDTAYNDVVKSIVDSNLEIRAKQNGSNKFGEAIRKAALIPFHFLAEDPTLYNDQQRNCKCPSREIDNQVFANTNPAVDVLMLLRNSSGQLVKRIRVNPDPTDQLRGITSCYNFASSLKSSNMINGLSEDDGISTTEFPQQD